MPSPLEPARDDRASVDEDLEDPSAATARTRDRQGVLPMDQAVAGEQSGEAARSDDVLAPGAPPGEKKPRGGRHRFRRKKEEKRKGAASFLRELPVLLLVAFLLALLIKTFLVQAFYIPSESMEPTLEVGDRVLVNKVVYRLHPPRRGDIIVFEDPNQVEGENGGGALGAFWRWLTQGLGVATSPERDFIKRVIGLPGEVVEIKRGVLFIDGKRIDEPYLHPLRDVTSFGPEAVKPDHLFVMGDNRVNSNDSRRSLGQIPFDRVVGKAFVIIWPPSRVGLVRGA